MMSLLRSLRILWFGPLPMALLAQARDVHCGLTVEYMRTKSSDQQFQQLTDGTVDAVVTAIDNVVEWNRQAPEADFRVYAQMESTTQLTLFGRHGIAGLDSLRGRNLLVDAPANGFAVALLALLDTVGMSGTDCTFVPAGGVTERLDALLAGDGDATLLGPPFDQVAAQAGCPKLASVNETWPQFPGQGLVLLRKRYIELAQALAAWLMDLGDMRDWMLASPDEAIKLLVDAGLPPAFAATAPNASPASWRPDRAGIELLIEHRQIAGLPGGDLRYSDLVDLSLFEQVVGKLAT
jgi:ABC-type nitrate/sulfonate/bicarbonate transport system substrate-binding protein